MMPSACLPFELNRAEVAVGQVPADRAVESLDVVEHVGPGGVPLPVDLSADRSVSSDEKKLSMAALSHTFLEPLIEQSTRLSAISRWNCSPAPPDRH
jgi:hypothetical protein